MRRLEIFVLAAVAAAASGRPAAAQESIDDSAIDVADLIRELRETQQQVRDLSGEVQELRARTGDSWLTDERAKQIRSLVADVLEDADHRASLMQGGLTAGWSDGFFLASPDGRFSLNIEGQMQIRWIFNYHDEPDKYRWGFENTRSKLTFRGHVLNRDLTYLLRIDATRNEPGLVTGLFFLQDAWVRYQLDDFISIRIGQYKVPFNREELVSSARQLAVERSLVNESSNLGRTQGVEITYADSNVRVMVSADDGATDNIGTFSLIEPGGEPLNESALVEDTEYSFTGRLEWKAAGTWDQFVDLTSPVDDPFGLLFGVAVHAEEGEHGAPAINIRTEERWVAFTFDVSAEFGGANFFASYVQHYVDGGQFDIKYYGVVVQGGYYFTPKFEVFGRGEWAQFQIDGVGIGFDQLTLATVGFNYYFDGHDAKLTTDFGFTFGLVDRSFDSDITGFRRDFSSDTQLVFRTQFQLLF